MKTKQLILLGPPGLAVTEHAATLAASWRIPHVSMTDLLPGIEAPTRVPPPSAGEPGPDNGVLKSMRRRFEQPDVVLKGWVLDGFPQTPDQAVAFDGWWAKFSQSPAPVVYLKAMTGLLMNRLAESSGESAPALRRRIEAHQNAIAPILDYYQQRSRLTILNASRSFAEVAAALAQIGQAEESGVARLIPNEAALDDLLATETSLVVDCMAAWCGSCKQIIPAMDRLATAYGDRATVVKIDFDVNRNITKRFSIPGIPAVMFFRGGELRETLVGVKAYPEYEAALTRLLASVPVNDAAPVSS